jgi:Cu/Ag efflux pump CusA
MDNEVYQASAKIRGSAAFGEIIILIVYLPILALVGIEGKMFKPMAQTVSFAILGAFILSLTYVPMMAALFLSKKTGHEPNISDRIIASCYRIYRPILEGALKMKGLVVGIAVAFFLVSMLVFGRLGRRVHPYFGRGRHCHAYHYPAGQFAWAGDRNDHKGRENVAGKIPRNHPNCFQNRQRRESRPTLCRWKLPMRWSF